jgi:hypothetical protein
VHHARFMAKSIYLLKMVIYYLRELIWPLTKKETFIGWLNSLAFFTQNNSSDLASQSFPQLMPFNFTGVCYLTKKKTVISQWLC